MAKPAGVDDPGYNLGKRNMVFGIIQGIPGRWNPREMKEPLDDE